MPDPDSLEAQAYFDAQIRAIHNTYPGLACVVLTPRGGGGKWSGTREEEMPPLTRKAFQAFVRKHPSVTETELGGEQDVHAKKADRIANLTKTLAGRYMINRVYEAYRRAVREIMGEDTGVMLASWRSGWIWCGSPRHTSKG